MVKLPGVKRPAMACAPVLAANLRTARWPYGRAEMTQTSLGFSMAAMMRAARTIFSHVLPTLRTLMPAQASHRQLARPARRSVHEREEENVPSERRFQTYGSIFFSTFLVL